MYNFFNTVNKFVLTSLVCYISTSGVLAQQTKWSLQQCITHSLDKNIALKQSKLNNEVNSINYKQAKANVLPNLNFADVQSFNYINNPNTATIVVSNQNGSSNQAGLNSSITLYNGLKNINLIKENRLNYESGNLDLEKMKNDLLLNVVAAYMQVLFEYEAVDMAQSQIDITIEHLNYTEKYVKAGSLPEGNLLQVQAQLYTDKATKVGAETQLQLAKVILMQLMEIPVVDSFDVARPDLKEIVPDVALTSDEIYAIAVNFLPEVKSAAIKTSSNEYGLKVAKSEIMPKLVLSGSLASNYSSYNSLLTAQTSSSMMNIGYVGSNPNQLVYGPVTTTTTNEGNYPAYKQLYHNFGEGISLSLNVPIYNNLLYKSDIGRSKIALQVAQLNETAVKNQLRKNIEQAYIDQLAASKNFIATKEELVAEERSYRDISIKFKAGLINTTDFFVEKNNYSKAILAQLQAKYNYVFKTKIVNFYTGKPITP